MLAKVLVMPCFQLPNCRISTQHLTRITQYDPRTWDLLVRHTPNTDPGNRRVDDQVLRVCKKDILDLEGRYLHAGNFERILGSISKAINHEKCAWVNAFEIQRRKNVETGRTKNSLPCRRGIYLLSSTTHPQMSSWSPQYPSAIIPPLRYNSPISSMSASVPSSRTI